LSAPLGLFSPSSCSASAESPCESDDEGDRQVRALSSQTCSICRNERAAQVLTPLHAKGVLEIVIEITSKSIAMPLASIFRE
jgi:hypothetical protein